MKLPPTIIFPFRSAEIISSVISDALPSTMDCISPLLSPPIPKIPWIKTPFVLITTPSSGMTPSISPSIYASTSTGIGDSLKTTCPVTVDIDSIVPLTGESTLDLKKPKRPFVSAKRPSFSIDSPLPFIM